MLIFKLIRIVRALVYCLIYCIYISVCTCCNKSLHFCTVRRTLKPHPAVITAISGDDGILMSILMNATSLGSQLADNYDRPQYYHNGGSISSVRNQNAEECTPLCLLPHRMLELKINMRHICISDIKCNWFFLWRDKEIEALFFFTCSWQILSQMAIFKRSFNYWAQQR